MFQLLFFLPIPRLFCPFPTLHHQEVLKSVRAADKFCMDIMCILLLLGLIAVLYGVIKNT